MNYGNIKNCDIANGEGIRITLFVSGCTHHCKNCFNQETWDFNYGNVFDKKVEDNILEMLTPNYINGLTILGGEPFEPKNQKALLPFIKRIREKFGDKKNIWAYTGYIYDIDLVEGGRAFTQETNEILSQIDVLVDGPFVENLKNISLKFRGSSNQRIIDMKKTLKEKQVYLYLL